MTSHRTVSRVLGVAVLALGFSAFASATEADVQSRKLEVKYSDLDLSQKADVERLYTRITYAARNVCKQSRSVTSRVAQTNDPKCVDQAIEQTVEGIGNEDLTALYRQKAGNQSIAASSR